MLVLAVLLGGALYEFAAVLWVRHSERGEPARAAAASAACAACLVVGLGESVRTPTLAPAFVAGYALGTYLAVRLRA